jgi:hypothetical protein
MSLWSRLTPRQAEMCELLIQGYPNVKMAELFGVTKSCIKNTFQRIYRKFHIDYKTCLPHIRLAVMLTYERYPQLVPRIGMGATVSYHNQRGWSSNAHPGECSISYTQPEAYTTGQNKPTSAPFDHDSASLGRNSPAHSYIH